MYLGLVWLVGSVSVKELPGFVHELGDPGLLWDYYMWSHISIWSPLLYIGVIIAGLSSALASLVGAPRLFQVYFSFALMIGCLQR